MLGGSYEEAIVVGTAGLETARELGAEEIEASVLITLGTASDALNRSGFDELEQGIAIADRLNIPREFTRGHNNVAEQLVVRGDITGAERALPDRARADGTPRHRAERRVALAAAGRDRILARRVEQDR